MIFSATSVSMTCKLECQRYMILPDTAAESARILEKKSSIILYWNNRIFLYTLFLKSMYKACKSQFTEKEQRIWKYGISKISMHNMCYNTGVFLHVYVHGIYSLFLLKLSVLIQVMQTTINPLADL